MAGSNSRELWAATSEMFAAGKAFRTAAIAGTVRIRSPILLSWMRRTFNRPLTRPLHRQFVSIEQACAEMVPREIFHHALPCREAHPFHDFRMIIELLNRRRERIDICRRDDDSLDAVLDYVARFACRDLRKTTGRRLVSDFGTPFALRGKNMNGRRAKIFFGVVRKCDQF